MHQVINKNDVNEGVLLQQHKNLEGLFYLLQTKVYVLNW